MRSRCPYGRPLTAFVFEWEWGRGNKCETVKRRLGEEQQAVLAPFLYIIGEMNVLVIELRMRSDEAGPVRMGSWGGQCRDGRDDESLSLDRGPLSCRVFVGMTNFKISYAWRHNVSSHVMLSTRMISRNFQGASSSCLARCWNRATLSTRKIVFFFPFGSDLV